MSSDSDEKASLAYQKDYRMRFPAVRFDALDQIQIPPNPGLGIPALLMVDKNGEIVRSCSDVPRSECLDEAKKSRVKTNCLSGFDNPIDDIAFFL